MSVGTNENENVKNINQNIQDFNNVEETVIEVNTGENEESSSVDMQQTQRIVILDELRKDTEKSTKELIQNQSKTDIPQEKILNENTNELRENKLNETINIPNSSSENSTELIAQAESPSAISLSENTVQKTPNQLSQQSNTQNTQEISSEETLKNKEKQHAQDKKDYRLEKMLFDRINKMQGKIKESLELIKKFERINAKEENLPNIVTTLHDKLTHEVIKQFRTVGIEFNMKSYLVQSIVSDLLGKFEDGITEFKDCSENLNFVREVQEDFESRIELAPTSKVKNFFARLRGMFKPERKQEKLEQLERERQEKKLEEANIHLIKYKFINGELEKYTIRKNIVNSLTREILHGQGSGLTLSIKEFINEKISSEMKKLGLENKIPELEDKLYNEYRDKDPDITQEEFSQMSVGELKRNIKLQKSDIIRTKIGAVIAGNNSTDEDEKMVV